MKTHNIIRILLFVFLILFLLAILIFAKPLSTFVKSLSANIGDPKANLSIVDPFATSENGSMAAITANMIQELEIDWESGSVTILPGTEEHTIRFWDDHSGDEKYQLYYTISDDTLKIRFCEDVLIFGTAPEKNLVVEVPENWICEELEIETDSASIVMNLRNLPKSMDLDTSSGNLDITLPDNAGFSMELDTMSGKLTSEFHCEMVNNRYVWGDGICAIDIDTRSGNVVIHKNASLSAGVFS